MELSLSPLASPTSCSLGTVSGNVIVNTIAGVPAATFQSINKRLASPVAPGALTVSCSRAQRAYHDLHLGRLFAFFFKCSTDEKNNWSPLNFIK